MTALRWSGWLVFAAAVAVIVFAIVLVATPGGSRWLAAVVTERAGGRVELLGVSGTLVGPLEIERLVLRLDAATIEVEDLRIAPDWPRVYERRALVLASARASRLHVDVVERPRKAEAMRVTLPVLPIVVTVSRLDVDRLESDRVPRELWPRAGAGVELAPSKWSVRRLNLESEALTLAGDVTAAIRGDVPIEGTLEWASARPDAKGRVTLAGDLRTLHGAFRLEAPAPLTVDASLELIGRTVAVLTAEVPPQDVRLADLSVDAFAAQARMELAAVPALQGTARAASGEWSARRFTAAALDIEGTLDGYAGHARATLHAERQPEATVEVRFEGSRRALDLSRASVTTRQGRAELAGRVVFEPLGLRLGGTLEGFDPSHWLPSLSGRLAGAFDVDYSDGRLGVDAPDISGTLNGDPFALSIQGLHETGVWSVERLHVVAGSNRIEGSGRWTPERIAGRGRFELGAIEHLYPDVSGSATGDFDFSGTIDAPTFAARLDVPRIERGADHVTEATLDVQVVAGRAEHVEARIAGLAIGGVAVEDVEVSARGGLENFAVDLSGRTRGERASVAATGRWRDDRLWLRVGEAARVGADGEAVRLDRDIDVSWSRAGAFEVGSHCWLREAGQGRLCLASVSNDRLEGRLEALPVALLGALVTGLPEIGGSLAGDFRFVRGRQGWQGAAELGSDGLALRGLAAGEDDRHGDVALGNVSLGLTVELDRARLEGTVEGLEHGAIDLALDLEGISMDGVLDGRVRIEVADIAPLGRFSRRVGEIGGRVNGEIVIDGTLGDPRLTGTLSLSDGRIALVDPRVDLDALSIDLVAPNAGRVEIRGRGKSASGSFTIEGFLLEPLAPTRSLELAFRSEDLDIGLPEGELLARVDAALRWVPGAFDVSGNVVVPKARIKVADRPPSVVRRSEDVIVVDREVVAPIVTRLAVDVRVTLGDDVRFKGLGLDTRLTGRVRLRETRDGAVRVNGTVNVVDGEFSVLGQTLKIESGRLTFAGPIDDPFVDARATRTIEEGGGRIVAGINISGRTRALESTLFSTPAMPDSQVLSYLVLGRPLDAATAEEGTDMTGAAVALGLKGAAPVIDEIRGAFGLEELGAAGGSTEELELIAGKRLSQKLFVRYTYQTFTRMSALLVQLALTDRLRLEATAAEAPAMDLIYRVGRGG